MTKKKISAKEIASDIKAGMNKSDLLKKYNIPSLEKFESLIDKLVNHKLLNDADKAKLFQKFACPACGVCNSGTFSECPSCGIIVSKYKKEKDVEINSLLQKCKACGGQVSKNAKTCPHCGEPTVHIKVKTEISTEEKSKPNVISFLGKAFGWFFGIVFLIAAFGPLSTSKYIQGISYLVTALILIPPILPKLRINLSTKMKLISFFVLIMIGGILQDTLYSKPNKEPDFKVHYSTPKDTSISIEEANSARKSRFFPDLNNIEGVKKNHSKTFSNRKWYQDGNLHNKTVNDWKIATYANKLATSADMATASKKVKTLMSQSSSIDSIKPFAVELMTCIDEAAAGKGYQNMKVAELAAGCMILMK